MVEAWMHSTPHVGFVVVEEKPGVEGRPWDIFEAIDCPDVEMMHATGSKAKGLVQHWKCHARNR